MSKLVTSRAVNALKSAPTCSKASLIAPKLGYFRVPRNMRCSSMCAVPQTRSSMQPAPMLSIMLTRCTEGCRCRTTRIPLESVKNSSASSGMITPKNLTSQRCRRKTPTCERIVLPQFFRSVYASSFKHLGDLFGTGSFDARRLCIWNRVDVSDDFAMYWRRLVYGDGWWAFLCDASLAEDSVVNERRSL